MNNIFKKFGAIVSCCAISGTVVALSNSYFAQIKASDVETSKQISDKLDEWYDRIETENGSIENDKNNALNDPSLAIKPKPGGNGGNNSGNGNVPVEVPKFESGLQAFEFANNMLKQAKTINIKSSGSVTSMGITQKAQNVRMKDANGSLYYSAVSASSIVKVGLEAYSKAGRGFRYSKTDNVSSSLVANYTPNCEVYGANISRDAFKDMLGSLPSELPYVVNEETVLNTVGFSNNGSNVVFTLQLDPVKSTVNYKRSVKYMAGDKNDPVFSQVQLTVTINAKTGQFVSIKSDNKYKALGFACEEKITDIFAVNASVTIPVPSWY